MVHEITNTKGKYMKFPPIPDGRRKYIIVGPAKGIPCKNGDQGFVFPLQYENDEGQNCLGETMLMPSMMGGLLRAIGCAEPEDDVFDWYTDEVEGRAFIATTSHAPDKKDPNITRVHFSEFTVIGDPYENPVETQSAEA